MHLTITLSAIKDFIGDNEMTEFDGEKFRWIRLGTDKNVRDVCYELRHRHNVLITEQTLYNYEKGRSVPDANLLPILAQVLNCSPEDFYSEVE